MKENEESKFEIYYSRIYFYFYFFEIEWMKFIDYSTDMC